MKNINEIMILRFNNSNKRYQRFGSWHILQQIKSNREKHNSYI